MERMYETYRDIAEFRLIYIAEAHAADSYRAVGYAEKLGIRTHKNYSERCETAARLLGDKSLTIPTLIDAMDDTVSKAYQAHPDRIFVVRKDGRIAVAAARGPRGFAPALKATQTWLAEYKMNGVEPALPAAPKPEGKGGSEGTGSQDEPSNLGPSGSR